MEKLSIDEMKQVSRGSPLSTCLGTCYWWNVPCHAACLIAFEK